MMKPNAPGGRRRRWAVRGGPAALLLMAAAPASHAQLAYDVLAGVGETDNVRLTPDHTRADTMALVGFDLSWIEQSRNFDADVTANVEYLDFARHSYAGEVLGNLLADMEFHLIPNRLRWSLHDNLGQGSIDPAAPGTPANHENINYFSTGPDLSLPLSSADQMLLEGRYSNVNYEVSPLSSNRYSAGLGVRHDLSALSGISFNVQDEAIRYQNSDLNPDYDEQEAYLRYDAKGIRTRLSFDVGYDHLKLQDGTANGPLARLELTRQLSPTQSVVLTAGRDFSDVGNEFLLLQALGGATLDTQAVGATGAPFKQDYVTAGWNFQQFRTGFGVGGGYYKLRYFEIDTLDEERTTAGAHYTRRMTPRLEGGLYASYTREQFPNLVNGNYNQIDVSAAVTYHINSRFTMDVELAHGRRDATTGLTSYTDDRAWIKFKYGRPLPPPPPASVPPLPAFPGQMQYQMRQLQAPANPTQQPQPTP